MPIKQRPEPEWSLGEVVSIDLKTDRETVSQTAGFVTVGDDVQIHIEGPDALAIATKIAAVPDLIEALRASITARRMLMVNMGFTEQEMALCTAQGINALKKAGAFEPAAFRADMEKLAADLEEAGAA